MRVNAPWSARLIGLYSDGDEVLDEQITVCRKQIHFR